MVGEDDARGNEEDEALAALLYIKAPTQVKVHLYCEAPESDARGTYDCSSRTTTPVISAHRSHLVD